MTAALTRVRSLLINTAEGAPIGTMIHTITEHRATVPRGPAWTHRANRHLRHIATQLPSWAGSLSYWIQDLLDKPNDPPPDRR